MRLSTAYWDSQAFLTANRIGLFEVLAKRPLSLGEIASALGTNPRPTGLLLKACVALGLLEEDAKGYRNSPLSQTFLVPGTDAYLGNAVLYSDAMYGPWGQLEHALKADCPPMQPDTYLGSNPEITRRFVYGMHNRALAIGSALVELVDLSGRRQMLDVGGGAGTYSALFTLRYPGLHSRILELPDVAALAREILGSMGAGDLVEVVTGDYRATRFPNGNDIVLISGVFHRETKATCEDLIARAHDSLNPDGLLVVNDVFTDAGGAGPLFATLFGLNMMLSAADGGVHSDAEVTDWMTQARFEEVESRQFPPPVPHRLVVGRKA